MFDHGSELAMPDMFAVYDSPLAGEIYLHSPFGFEITGA